MSTSTYPAVIDALTTALRLRAALSGVGVFAEPPGDGSRGYQEWIEFGDVAQTLEDHSMGGNLRETYTIEGSLYVVKPGADGTVAKTARDRAYALLADLESYINDNDSIGDTCAVARLETVDTEQPFNQEGRFCIIDFTLRITAVINP